MLPLPPLPSQPPPMPLPPPPLPVLQPPPSAPLLGWQGLQSNGSHILLPTGEPFTLRGVNVVDDYK